MKVGFATRRRPLTGLRLGIRAGPRPESEGIVTLCAVAKAWDGSPREIIALAVELFVASTGYTVMVMTGRVVEVDVVEEEEVATEKVSKVLRHSLICPLDDEEIT